MHRIDHTTATAVLPTPDDAGTPGYFTKGNPATAAAATVFTADFANTLQEEFCYVIEQSGLTLSKTNNTQLRQAILNMIQSANSAVIITGATFEASVANGEVVRWDAANSRFDEALADGTVNNQAVGIADVTNSRVYCYGETPALFSGLTPGSKYYLHATTAGAITATKPSDGVIVGIAKSATVLFVDIDLDPSASLPALGQCRLDYVSTTQIKLSPKNGNKLTINGAAYAIPSAGVALANTGLAASSVYNVYAYMNSGTMTLEASATGHSTDTASGVEIKTGDATRTLVGMVDTDNSTLFTNRLRSWFNDNGFALTTALTADQGSIGSDYTEITGLRASFLVWANEIVRVNASIIAQNNVSGLVVFAAAGFDGIGALEDGGAFSKPAAAGYADCLALHVLKTGLSEGLHYVAAAARGNAGTTTVNGSATAGERSHLCVYIKNG